MDVQLINTVLTCDLHEKAIVSDRLRMNYDLRTTPKDSSQRMLNALEVGTNVPIHRHLKTSETAICIEGCLEWVFYEELPNLDMDDSIYNAEVGTEESCFREIARYRICPREGKYGIQVPKGSWHRVIALESSTIFEAKDGKFGK